MYDVWYLSDFVFRGVLDWLDRERGTQEHRKVETPRYIPLVPLPYENWAPVARYDADLEN